MPGEAHLEENDFGAGPLHAASRLLDELLERAEPGLRLWAPAFVALDRQQPVHVHVGAHGAAVELERLALPDRVTVVAVDLVTGRTRAVRVGGTGGRHAPSRLAPAPGFEGGLGPSSRARAAQAGRCLLWDAAGASALRTGRYRLTAIAADRVSNDVTIELGRSSSTVDRAASLPPSSGQVWPSPDPGGGLPRYDAIEGSLSPPEQYGVIIGAARVAQAANGEACVLQGALRAHPRAHEQARHGAVIPVTLVIVGSVSPEPTVVPMLVPSFDRDDAAFEAGLTARFAVDLFQLAPLAETPQTYFVHAFTADGRASSQPVAIVAG